MCRAQLDIALLSPLGLGAAAKQCSRVKHGAFQGVVPDRLEAGLAEKARKRQIHIVSRLHQVVWGLAISLMLPGCGSCEFKAPTEHRSSVNMVNSGSCFVNFSGAEIVFHGFQVAVHWLLDCNRHGIRQPEARYSVSASSQSQLWGFP